MFVSNFIHWLTKYSLGSAQIFRFLFVLRLSWEMSSPTSSWQTASKFKPNMTKNFKFGVSSTLQQPCYNLVPKLAPSTYFLTKNLPSGHQGHWRILQCGLRRPMPGVDCTFFCFWGSRRTRRNWTFGRCYSASAQSPGSPWLSSHGSWKCSPIPVKKFKLQ